MSNYEKMADNELVLLANDGDDVAMEILISRYKNFVRAKTRSYFLIGADTPKSNTWLNGWCVVKVRVATCTYSSWASYTKAPG